MSCSTRSSASYVARPKRGLSSGFTAVSAPEGISIPVYFSLLLLRRHSNEVCRYLPRSTEVFPDR